VSGASRQIEIGYSNDQLFEFASKTVQFRALENHIDRQDGAAAQRRPSLNGSLLARADSVP
jgi:hypothetical protein